MSKSVNEFLEGLTRSELRRVVQSELGKSVVGTVQTSSEQLIADLIESGFEVPGGSEAATSEPPAEEPKKGAPPADPPKKKGGSRKPKGPPPTDAPPPLDINDVMKRMDVMEEGLAALYKMTEVVKETNDRIEAGLVFLISASVEPIKSLKEVMPKKGKDPK